MRRLLYSLLLFCSLQVVAQNDKETIQVTDMLQIKQVVGVTISADGSKTAFMVNSIEPDGDTKWEYKYLNQLFVVSNDGLSQPKALTNKENAAQPAWSPDGKQLAFVRVVDGKTQVFLISMDGGEAQQLTRFKYGANYPKWSPDGTKILFSASVSLKEMLKDSSLNPSKSIPKWPFEKPGFIQNEQLNPNNAKADPNGSLQEIRAYLDLNATDKKAKVFNKLNFQEEMTTSPELGFNQFFLVPVNNGTKVTAVTHGFYRFQSADFTPNGNQLIILGDIDSTEHPDRSLESAIYLANADGSNLTLLLGEKDKTYTGARVSPSGKMIAFFIGKTSFVTIPQLAIMPLNGTAKDIVLLPFDRNIGGIVWTADEQWIYYSTQSNGGQPLYRMNVKSKKAEALSDFNTGITSFDLKNDVLVYSKTSIENPSELYISNNEMKQSKVISSFNSGWLQNKRLSIPEKYRFKNELGLEVEYWVMKPANFQSGKKYPTILNIHGGPTAMWGPGEASMWHEFQYYSAKGYVVVYGNPRGSGGYGQEFMRSNINDWGAGPCSDVLTYLNKATELGFIDTSKMAVTGGSYAGYLVAWIVGHDQRFKAACAQRGVYDLATFFGEGNAWRLVPNYFGGYPWEEKSKAILERESPINYVANIHTPLIIFHGENDLRTGVIQSEMFYRSLKILGRPVEYVRHPGATHELTRSGNNRQRIDQMLRTMEFFERYIRH